MTGRTGHDLARRIGRRSAARPLIRPRRGSALVLVMIAIVVLAVLSTGAILGSMAELRAAHNEQMAQRALTVAEYGLNRQLANWTASRNQMANGAVDSSQVPVTHGDTATVRVMRLNSRTFWIVSVGRTNRSNGQLEAQRTVNLLVGLASPSVRAGAAITSFGNTDVQGSPNITGRSTDPSGWTGCPVGRDTFAIAVSPSKNATVQRPATQAVGGVTRDPNAGDTLTYRTFGNETWNSLVARANITLTSSNPSSPAPAGSVTTCTTSNSNWGEPNRGGGSIVGCQGYFPIIYSPGSLSLSGGRGQGVLLVNGNLTVNGNFYFVGLIVVMNDLRANGNMEMLGAVLTRNTTTDNYINGNAKFSYSPCALSNALRGAATPARTRQRAWAQLY